MFEEYLQDAHNFFKKAVQTQGNDGKARTYFRASIFCSSSAVEAFVNYHGDSFAKAEKLPAHEIAFLNDKAIYFSATKGITSEKIEYHKLDDKLRVLIRRFVSNYNFNSTVWNNLVDFKKLRDSLVHPRKFEDETDLIEYNERIKKGLNAIIEIMNIISKGIHGKPLRKKLLDLTLD